MTFFYVILAAIFAVLLVNFVKGLSVYKLPMLLLVQSLGL